LAHKKNSTKKHRNTEKHSHKNLGLTNIRDINLLSASCLKQTSNMLDRSLVIWDHTVLPETEVLIPTKYMYAVNC